MKEKIKFTVLGVLIGLLTSGTVAFAEKPIKILLDEKPIDGAEAIIYNDRTYVPVRVIADAFGFETFWDEENWQVKIKRNKKLGGKPTDLKKEGEVETPIEKDLPIKDSLKDIQTDNEFVAKYKQEREAKTQELINLLKINYPENYGEFMNNITKDLKGNDYRSNSNLRILLKEIDDTEYNKRLNAVEEIDKLYRQGVK